ncbi:MAG: twin-arginine translocase TatA/TatE family subunit [Acidobacteriota bacterium]|nr:twin-arginine translocase TatA/TatE family subunit [Acidobacteriota bacterium]
MGAPLPIETANLGMADSLILMVLALVVFGPRRLPQIGKQIGKLMYEFRKASNDFKYQMEEELRQAEDADRRRKEEAARSKLLEAPAQPVSADPSVPAPEVNTIERSGSGTETSAPDATAVDATPKIQPPSTGEPVMASRPGPRAETEPEAQPVEGDRTATAASAPATETAQPHG